MHDDSTNEGPTDTILDLDPGQCSEGGQQRPFITRTRNDDGQSGPLVPPPSLNNDDCRQDKMESPVTTVGIHFGNQVDVHSVKASERRTHDLMNDVHAEVNATVKAQHTSAHTEHDDEPRKQTRIPSPSTHTDIIEMRQTGGSAAEKIGEGSHPVVFGPAQMPAQPKSPRITEHPSIDHRSGMQTASAHQNHATVTKQDVTGLPSLSLASSLARPAPQTTRPRCTSRSIDRPRPALTTTSNSSKNAIKLGQHRSARSERRTRTAPAPCKVTRAAMPVAATGPSTALNITRTLKPSRRAPSSPLATVDSRRHIMPRERRDRTSWLTNAQKSPETEVTPNGIDVACSVAPQTTTLLDSGLNKSPRSDPVGMDNTATKAHMSDRLPLSADGHRSCGDQAEAQCLDFLNTFIAWSRRTGTVEKEVDALRPVIARLEAGAKEIEENQQAAQSRLEVLAAEQRQRQEKFQASVQTVVTGFGNDIDGFKADLVSMREITDNKLEYTHMDEAVRRLEDVLHDKLDTHSEACEMSKQIQYLSDAKKTCRRGP